MKLCRAQKSDGTHCNAPPGPGSDFCFHHDPARREKAAEARQKATEAARLKKLADKSREPTDRKRLARTYRLNSLADVKKLLADTINEFSKGNISVEDAKCIAYVANILTQTIKDTEIESKLKEIESRIAERGVKL